MIRGIPRGVAVAWAALVAVGVGPVGGQGAGPRTAAAIRPDSIRVGEPFTLGLTVTLSAPGEVRFPAVLPLPDELEQRQPVQIRSSEGGTDWRAYYTLSAWTADTHRIPPIEVTLEAPEAAPVPLTLTAPAVDVRSVLPAATEDLELRDPRGFLRVRSFPWWILVALAGAAALASWLWWRRRPAPVPATPTGPGERALLELERLRRTWRAGQLAPGQFYDRFEAVVREYVGATRRWSPGRTLVRLGSGAGQLFRTLQRSLIVRFARVDDSPEGPETALQAGEAFVRAEMSPPETDAGRAPAAGDAGRAERGGP